MRNSIGFVIITHKNEKQIIRLISRLNKLFKNPPIVCHNDFSKLSINSQSFRKNFTFVRPYLKTEWAAFSVVDAVMLGLKQMQKMHAPQWTVIISGSCYPIKPAEVIQENLTKGDFDVHMHFEKIEKNNITRDWHRLCYERYFSVPLKCPQITRPFKINYKNIVLKNSWMTRPFAPFSKTQKCFAGSQWFSINSCTANKLISFHSSNSKIKRHFEALQFSEESYFHTLLCNQSGIRINNNNWHYIDWSEGNSHPKTLTLVDRESVLASPHHFARKLDINVDQKILDEIDKHVDQYSL